MAKIQKKKNIQICSLTSVVSQQKTPFFSPSPLLPPPQQKKTKMGAEISAENAINEVVQEAVEQTVAPSKFKEIHPPRVRHMKHYIPRPGHEDHQLRHRFFFFFF